VQGHITLRRTALLFLASSALFDQTICTLDRLLGNALQWPQIREDSILIGTAEAMRQKTSVQKPAKPSGDLKACSTYAQPFETIPLSIKAGTAAQTEASPSTVPIEDTIIAIQATHLLISCVSKYKTYIRTHIENNPVRLRNDEKELKSQLLRLHEFETFGLLMYLWLNSDFLDIPELGINLKARRAPITRNALGNRLEELDGRDLEFNSSQKYIRRASRYVDAAMTFGLIALEDETNSDNRSNYKPLIATQKLHDLMLEVGLNVGMLMAAAVAPPELRNSTCNSNGSER
jgi:hypothetical protein